MDLHALVGKDGAAWTDGVVTSVCADSSFLYVGLQDGRICVFQLFPTSSRTEPWRFAQVLTVQAFPPSKSHPVGVHRMKIDPRFKQRILFAQSIEGRMSMFALPDLRLIARLPLLKGTTNFAIQTVPNFAAAQSAQSSRLCAARNDSIIFMAYTANGPVESKGAQRASPVPAAGGASELPTVPIPEAVLDLAWVGSFLFIARASGYFCIDTQSLGQQQIRVELPLGDKGPLLVPIVGAHYFLRYYQAPRPAPADADEPEHCNAPWPAVGCKPLPPPPWGLPCAAEIAAEPTESAAPLLLELVAPASRAATVAADLPALHVEEGGGQAAAAPLGTDVPKLLNKDCRHDDALSVACYAQQLYEVALKYGDTLVFLTVRADGSRSGSREYPQRRSRPPAVFPEEIGHVALCAPWVTVVCPNNTYYYHLTERVIVSSRVSTPAVYALSFPPVVCTATDKGRSDGDAGALSAKSFGAAASKALSPSRSDGGDIAVPFVVLLHSSGIGVLTVMPSAESANLLAASRGSNDAIAALLYSPMPSKGFTSDDFGEYLSDNAVLELAADIANLKTVAGLHALKSNRAREEAFEDLSASAASANSLLAMFDSAVLLDGVACLEPASLAAALGQPRKSLLSVARRFSYDRSSVDSASVAPESTLEDSAPPKNSVLLPLLPSRPVPPPPVTRSRSDSLRARSSSVHNPPPPAATPQDIDDPALRSSIRQFLLRRKTYLRLYYKDSLANVSWMFSGGGAAISNVDLRGLDAFALKSVCACIDSVDEEVAIIDRGLFGLYLADSVGWESANPSTIRDISLGLRCSTFREISTVKLAEVVSVLEAYGRHLDIGAIQCSFGHLSEAMTAWNTSVSTGKWPVEYIAQASAMSVAHLQSLSSDDRLEYFKWMLILDPKNSITYLQDCQIDRRSRHAAYHEFSCVHLCEGSSFVSSGFSVPLLNSVQSHALRHAERIGMSKGLLQKTLEYGDHDALPSDAMLCDVLVSSQSDISVRNHSIAIDPMVVLECLNSQNIPDNAILYASQLQMQFIEGLIEDYDFVRWKSTMRSTEKRGRASTVTSPSFAGLMGSPTRIPSSTPSPPSEKHVTQLLKLYLLILREILGFYSPPMKALQCPYGLEAGLLGQFRSKLLSVLQRLHSANSPLPYDTAEILPHMVACGEYRSIVELLRSIGSDEAALAVLVYTIGSTDDAEQYCEDTELIRPPHKKSKELTSRLQANDLAYTPVGDKKLDTLRSPSALHPLKQFSLCVRVIEATGLKGEKGPPDPYVVVKCEGTVRKIPGCKSSTDPFWGAELEIGPLNTSEIFPDADAHSFSAGTFSLSPPSGASMALVSSLTSSAVASYSIASTSAAAAAAAVLGKASIDFRVCNAASSDNDCLGTASIPLHDIFSANGMCLDTWLSLRESKMAKLHVSIIATPESGSMANSSLASDRPDFAESHAAAEESAAERSIKTTSLALARGEYTGSERFGPETFPHSRLYTTLLALCYDPASVDPLCMKPITDEKRAQLHQFGRKLLQNHFANINPIDALQLLPTDQGVSLASISGWAMSTIARTAAVRVLSCYELALQQSASQSAERALHTHRRLGVVVTPTTPCDICGAVLGRLAFCTYLGKRTAHHRCVSDLQRDPVDGVPLSSVALRYPQGTVTLPRPSCTSRQKDVMYLFPGASNLTETIPVFMEDRRVVTASDVRFQRIQFGADVLATVRPLNEPRTVPYGYQTNKLKTPVPRV